MSRTKMWFKRNSSLMLSILGAAGVVVTAVTAVRATPKALSLIDEAEKEKGEALSKTEIIVTAGGVYIPSLLIGVSTIACVLSAAVLSRRQQASLMSAYALLNRSYREYRQKLKELYGEDAHKNIVDSIAKEHCEDTHIYCSGAIYNSTLDVDSEHDPEIIRTFYDCYSKRYFETTLSKVIQAEYHLNRNYMLWGEITVNEFYDFLGIKGIKDGDGIGWVVNDDFYYWVDFNHRLNVLDDGMEVFMIEMIIEPCSIEEAYKF